MNKKLFSAETFWRVLTSLPKKKTGHNQIKQLKQNLVITLIIGFQKMAFVV